MIIICFSFLGTMVKITAEGNHTTNEYYDKHPRLKIIQHMNDSLLHKDSDKFKDAYNWCSNHASDQFKKGRSTNFAF
ncbi:MAG: hypothetical protein ACTSO3_01310 [Candidatus Heimdallarchaeaceae archaeon]